jgi:hypothetical protein
MQPCPSHDAADHLARRGSRTAVRAAGKVPMAAAEPLTRPTVQFAGRDVFKE